MARGGYQKPSKPAAVSGPGKLSQRTDGRAGQPIREPDIDNPDLQYGDRERLTEAQRIARAGTGQGAKIEPRRMTGTPGATGAQLPPWFSQTPDTDPASPTTAGLGMGEGPGSEILDASQPTDDVREVVLQYLASTFNNKAAADMLSQLRAERAAAAAPQMPFPATLGGGLPPEEPTQAQSAPATSA